MNALFADLILYLHFSYVLYILVGLLAIYIGGWLRRPFARNFWFRITHIAAIAIVAAEALLGIVCPLTHLENMLRDRADDERSFMSKWVQDLLFYSPYDVPPWVFTLAYVAVLALTAGAWLRFPPQRRRSEPSASA